MKWRYIVPKARSLQFIAGGAKGMWAYDEKALSTGPRFDVVVNPVRQRARRDIGGAVIKVYEFSKYRGSSLGSGAWYQDPFHAGGLGSRNSRRSVFKDEASFRRHIQ
jgi:hypothetical protein